MKLLREHHITVGDRKFLLKEFNGRRKSQLDDLQDQAETVVRKMAEAADDIERRRELRKQKTHIDRETYRLFLIPVEPDERTPDEWFDDNFSDGYFLHVVAVLQGALNQHKDVGEVGKSIEAKLKGENPPAETVPASSATPIFAAP